MDYTDHNKRLKAISKEYPTAWEEMCVEIGETSDTTLVSEWLYRQGCDWSLEQEKDGWEMRWSYQPEGEQTPSVACFKSLETGDEAFLKMIEHSFRAIELHLAPPQDFMDATTKAHANREKRKAYFKNKGK